MFTISLLSLYILWSNETLIGVVACSELGVLRLLQSLTLNLAHADCTRTLSVWFYHLWRAFSVEWRRSCYVKWHKQPFGRVSCSNYSFSLNSVLSTCWLYILSTCWLCLYIYGVSLPSLEGICGRIINCSLVLWNDRLEVACRVEIRLNLDVVFHVAFLWPSGRLLVLSYLN